MNLSKSSSIALVFPNNCIDADLKFTSAEMTFPKYLEIDLSVSLDYYPSISPINFESKFIAFLQPLYTCDQSSTFFTELQCFLSENSKMLCASSPIFIDTMFFLIPLRNSQMLGLYEFEISRVLGSNLKNYTKYISDLKTGKELLRNLCYGFERELKVTQEASKNIEVKCESLSTKCRGICKRLRLVKNKIKKLNNQFCELEKGFEKFECNLCRGNEKNVMFLPCGHITLCSDCLKADYKILVNFPIGNRRLKCMICSVQVEQTIEMKKN